MADLVNELHEEHNYMKELLEKIRAKGLTSEESRNELFRVKELLLSHMKKEDEKLYPVLKENAEKEDRFEETLRWYVDEMESISKKALDFFNKYENINNNSVEFSKDIGELIALLTQRIRKEEMVLFQKYKEVCR